jgi:hypothetical protein
MHPPRILGHSIDRLSQDQVNSDGFTVRLYGIAAFQRCWSLFRVSRAAQVMPTATMNALSQTRPAGTGAPPSLPADSERCRGA